MTIGELIKIAREVRGWSLRDLERECGVSNALISQIETGQVKNPGYFTVMRMINALGISADLCAQCKFEGHPDEAG